MQAAVPNTYAAAMASMAVWSKRPTAVAPAVIVDGAIQRCECGNVMPSKGRKRTVFDACERCRALDGINEAAETDDRVLRALGDNELTVVELVQELDYKFKIGVVTHALVRLQAAGRVTREEAARRDGRRYRRV